MKQNSIFKKTFVKVTAWTMAHLSWMTMAMSPVALGKESEKLNAQMLKASIQELQLNKKMTMKEFWEKTKGDYPGYAYYEIEQLVKSNPNMLVPQFQVRSVKGSNGAEVPVLTFVENGKTHTIQIYGDSKKYLTFDGVSITEAESTQPEKIVQKLMDHDAKIQKQYDEGIIKESGASYKAPRSEMRKTASERGRFSSFTSLPRMTPQMWSAMSEYERAQYLVEMRSLWQAARKVNFEAERIPAATPKTAPKKRTSSLENMYKLIFGQDVEAQTKCPPGQVRSDLNDASNGTCISNSVYNQRRISGVQVKSGSTTTPTPTVKQTPTPAPEVVKAPDTSSKPIVPTVDGQSNPLQANANQSANQLECTNAGWTTINVSSKKGGKCSYADILQNKNERYNKKFVQDIIGECTSGTVACNPLVYGYPNGKVLCISTAGNRSAPARGNYQKATHWDGPCDEGSRLTSAEILKSVNDAKLLKGGKYDKDSRQAQLDAIANDPENAALTEKFLDGILKRNNKANSLKDLLKSGKWDAETDNLMVQTQLSFEAEIQKAINNCTANALEKGQFDQNQKGACDQLHRRMISLEKIVSKYRSGACPDETQYLFAMTNDNGTNLAKNNPNLAKRATPVLPNAKDLNKRSAEELNKDKDNLPCGCYDKDSNKIIARFPLGASPEANKAAREKCEGTTTVVPPVVVDPCAVVIAANPSLKVKVDKSRDKENGGMCVCDPSNLPVKSELGEHSETLYYCEGTTPPPAAKCEKYAPLKLDENCNCVDKKGKAKGLPKKVNTGFKAIFTSSGKKSDKVGKDGMKSADGKGDRYTCDQGPNWWVIGGIAGGVAVLIALLTKKKKKCPIGTTGSYPNCKTPPNTCPPGTTGTYPVCNTPVRCEPPRVPVGETCVCPQSGMLWDGGACTCDPNLCRPGETQNPVTCGCTPVPSEGGDGDAPCTDPNGCWGGTGNGQQ